MSRLPRLAPLLLLAAPGWLAAADVAAPSPAPLSVVPAGGVGSLLTYFTVLIAMAAAGIYFVRNGWPKFGSAPAAARKLNICEMRSLGGRQFLVVVDYQGQKMLLGVTPGKIDYLSALDGGDGPENFDRSLPPPSLPEGVAS